ncbi:MAG: GGDEF domain-containing protein [Clostridia bacterium]|nr:GGDEF domain-containing protein [Clostridia bacterium]
MSLCICYSYNLELTNLFDKLTGVLNQGTYLKKIKDLKPEQIVIILDIDNFKLINDNYGHQYGDKCLSIISHILKSVFEKHGQCYRIGGDEFAVILRKNSNIESLITRFENNITEKFKNAPHKLSVSLGFSKFEKNDHFEAVIQRADSNMYNIKKQKKAAKEPSFAIN